MQNPVGAKTPPKREEERDEELRLALVMSGGVSLAVWMGGVSFEINRLIGETHPVYRGLLELTRTWARVDVISGTSAGGINGAALALACVYDTSLLPLRQVWLERGAFEQLLRDPGASDPPSLLDGDGVFLPALETAFEKLLAAKPSTAARVPMDLTLTATMLRGEPHARLDDLGERIEDAHHRAQFHFSREGEDPFAGAEIAGALAKAARTTASFPIAFEPLHAAAASCQSVAGNRPRPLAHARYLIDGGVLDNKPIDGALRAIFAFPPRGNVRRVLAYITPDPGASARAQDDSPEEPPTLAEVALGSLITITSTQSIADQLDRIDAHNAGVRQRRDTIATLAARLPVQGFAQLPDMLFDTYREMRIEGLLDYVLDELEDGLASAPGDPSSAVALGKHTREWLLAVWRSDPAADRYWEARIPREDDRWNFEFQPAGGWTWGLFALEFAIDLTLELLRRTQRLRHLATARPSGTRVAAGAADGDAGGNWEDLDARLRAERSGRYATVPPGDAELIDLWDRAFKLQRKLHEERVQSRLRFGEHAAELIKALADAGAGGANEEGLPAAARGWLMRRLVHNPADPGSAAGRVEDRKRRYAALAAEIAAVLLDLGRPMSALVAHSEKLREDEAHARHELGKLHQLLYTGEVESSADGKPDADRKAAGKALMRRVLQLEVVSFALVNREPEAGAYVELVQVSAQGASPWGGAATPSEKLAGMQLAHFGAFYRKAWRANDWMVGRLDGIDRLVRVALNPDRLHRLYAGTPAAIDDVLGAIRQLAVDSAEAEIRPELEAGWKADEDGLKLELGFLARRDSRVPETLPLASKALVRRLHLEVLRSELPEVARAVADDILDGTRADGPSAKLARHVESSVSISRDLVDRLLTHLPDAARARLQRVLPAQLPTGRLSAKEAVSLYVSSDYRIGGERILDEVGTDALTRMASRTIVVGHAALAGKSSGLAQFTKLLKPLRVPLRAFHLAADRLLTDSRSSAAITTTMLVCGVLFVLAAALAPEPVPGAEGARSPATMHAIAAIGWSLLVGWTATALLRRRLGLWLALGLLALLLVAVLGPAKLIVPAVATFALIFLLGRASWIGGAILSLIVLWWSAGAPSWDDMRAATCRTWQIVAHCPRAADEGSADLVAHLLVPLGVVIILGLLARLIDNAAAQKLGRRLGR